MFWDMGARFGDGVTDVMGEGGQCDEHEWVYVYYLRYMGCV